MISRAGLAITFVSVSIPDGTGTKEERTFHTIHILEVVVFVSDCLNVSKLRNM